MEVSTEVWQERARALLEESKVMSHFVIESSGVWNASERGTGFDDFPVDCEIERSDAAWTFAPCEWKPALAIPELADKDAPSLPFPFAAPELAAFMLGGMGVMVAYFFGDWAVGPSTQSLNKLPAGQSELRALVKGAYSAYRLAQERVGKWDDAALTRRDAAHKAHREKRNDKALLKAFDEAQAEWDAAHQAWLTAMIVCLLEPKPQAATTAPVPVVADSASNAPAINPPPVATRSIAFAFADLRGWNEKVWKDNLGSPGKWLQACIVFRGQRGVMETHWNPVLIGAALVRGGLAKQNSVRARFQTMPLLDGWLEAWKTYEADNFDTR